MSEENETFAKMLSNNDTDQIQNSSSEEWDENNSSLSGSYTESVSDQSYIANWENYVSNDGSLFYAEYSIPTILNKPTTSYESNTANTIKNNLLNRASSRRNSKKPGNNKNKKSIIDSNQKSNISTTSTQINHSSGGAGGGGGENSKVTFSEDYAGGGEIKELSLFIVPENRFKYGRRATITESLLGFSTSPFPDGIRLMVAGYLVQSELMHEKTIEIGDWFKSINDIEINANNLDEILTQFKKPTTITLKFQHILDEKLMITNTYNTIHQITNYETFSNQASTILQRTKQLIKVKEPPFCLIILPICYATSSSGDDDDDNNHTNNDVLFCYPEKEVNRLYSIRGSFLTLHTILKTELRTEPIRTRIEIDNINYDVCYCSQQKSLLLCGLSSEFVTSKEAQLRTSEIIQYINFAYGILDTKLTSDIQNHLYQTCQIIEVRLMQSKNYYAFEEILQQPQHFYLPKEAQLKIFDALNEMEAMDYRDWNDEPLNSHREFFIFGSALYFQSYLLASQMPVTQMTHLESVLRCNGIFDLIECQNVRDFVYWREISMENISNRYFLAICNRNQLLLAVILQAFETEHRLNDNGILEENIIGPSLFYIEEIQETLDHLRHGGIETLAKVWITSNKRPEMLTIGNQQSSSSNLSGPFENILPKKTEIASILKNRNLSEEEEVQGGGGGSSINRSLVPSVTHSDDSNHKDDSDSDWDGFPNSYKSSSGFDVFELKETFLKEIADILPISITAGNENILIRYVHIDFGSGMLIAPSIKSTDFLKNEFNAACHLIHNVLQNTKKFRKLLAQEHHSKSNVSQSMIAIKEHGIRINIKDLNGSNQKFWIIGRLFTSPTRELYVCHASDIPQNLVEIAFRLSFLTAG